MAKKVFTVVFSALVGATAALAAGWLWLRRKAQPGAPEPQVETQNPAPPEPDPQPEPLRAQAAELGRQAADEAREAISAAGRRAIARAKETGLIKEDFGAAAPSLFGWMAAALAVAIFSAILAQTTPLGGLQALGATTLVAILLFLANWPGRALKARDLRLREAESLDEGD